jgi:hypothetical protein
LFDRRDGCFIAEIAETAPLDDMNIEIDDGRSQVRMTAE